MNENAKKCEVCGTKHFVSEALGMCGPCVTGSADDLHLFDNDSSQDEKREEVEEPTA